MHLLLINFESKNTFLRFGWLGLLLLLLLLQILPCRYCPFWVPLLTLLSSCYSVNALILSIFENLLLLCCDPGLMTHARHYTSITHSGKQSVLQMLRFLAMSCDVTLLGEPNVWSHEAERKITLSVTAASRIIFPNKSCCPSLPRSSFLFSHGIPLCRKP